MTNTYQRIVERLADGVVLLDHEGRYLYLNPVAERVLGTTLPDAAGQVFWDAAPAAIGTAFRDCHRDLATGERRLILRNQFADGRWYDVVATPTHEDIFLVLHDVTERLLAQSARLESEQRFRLLVDGVKDYAIFMLDLNGEVASWNSGAERIKGYRTEEILGRHFSIFYPAEDVKRGKPRHALETAVAEGRYEEQGWRLRRDGSRFWASVVITTLRDSFGNPRGFAKVIHDDTERLRAQETEQRRLLALESAEIGTWEYLFETGTVICDARCKAMFGLPADADVSYELIISAIHPADQQMVRDAVERALAPETGGDYQAEYRLTGLRDRIERVISAKGKVLFDEQRRPYRYLGTVRDVSDIRRTQQALRTNAERLRLATSAVHMGAVDYFPSTGELIWDSQSKALWGLPPDAEVSLAVWLSGIHPDDRRRQEDAVRRALDPRSGGLLDEEYRVRARDGVERWIAVEAQVLFAPTGQPLRLIGMMRDITELRRAQDALRESEERLSLALAVAELGTWDYSLISGRLIVNARCCELLGVGRDAHVTLELLTAAIHPEDRSRFLELFDAQGRDTEIEVRTIGLGERVERWISLKGKLISNDGGRRVRSLGAIRDITERRRTEELQERLTGIFAHDLRAPLTAIVMANKLQEGLATLPEEARKAARTIGRSADRMTRMIRQLMDFTRMRIGAVTAVERESIDLATVCRDAAVEAEAANPGRTVRCIARGDCVGMFDRESVNRVLSNLLGNALQYGLPDRPIDLLVRGQEETVVVEVHNEGPPIPSELLPSIFDPFRRGQLGKLIAAETHAGPGLGLGLYITKELVESHDGTIEVSSTKAAGTTFTVRWPRGLPALVSRAADASAHLH